MQLPRLGRREWQYGESVNRSVLIVFDPDPIYNLDEQVCKTLGKVFAENNYHAVVASVAAAEGFTSLDFDTYVFCANTYNWKPDYQISYFIREVAPIENKNVIAVTLGSGSTEDSKQLLEKIIHDRDAVLIDSKNYWLLRPNDESQMEESNVEVALQMVEQWGERISKEL